MLVKNLEFFGCLHYGIQCTLPFDEFLLGILCWESFFQIISALPFFVKDMNSFFIQSLFLPPSNVVWPHLSQCTLHLKMPNAPRWWSIPDLSVLMTISMVIRMSQNYCLLPFICNYNYFVNSAQSFCNRGGMTEYRCCFASLRTFSSFCSLSILSTAQQAQLSGKAPQKYLNFFTQQKTHSYLSIQWVGKACQFEKMHNIIVATTVPVFPSPP